MANLTVWLGWLQLGDYSELIGVFDSLWVTKLATEQGRDQSRSWGPWRQITGDRWESAQHDEIGGQWSCYANREIVRDNQSVQKQQEMKIAAKKWELEKEIAKMEIEVDALKQELQKL